MTTTTTLRFLRPRRLGEDAGHLAWSLVHPAADGSVLLESGAPMTDGSTAYLLWLRIDDSDVEISEGGTAWRASKYGGPLARYDGRWYSHEYDEGGLQGAKATAAHVAHEAAK